MACCPPDGALLLMLSIFPMLPLRFSSLIRWLAGPRVGWPADRIELRNGGPKTAFPWVSRSNIKVRSARAAVPDAQRTTISSLQVWVEVLFSWNIKKDRTR